MATDGVNLGLWRESLKELRSDFKTNAASPCRARLLHYATPSVAIPSDWSQRPDDGGHRPTKTRLLMMEGRSAFRTAPGGNGYVTAWKRHLELFGDTEEIRQVYSLSRQASELLWSLDEAVRSDPWVYRFTPEPFQYVTDGERWFGTVFELAWHENKSSRLRAPRWTWSPVNATTTFTLRTGDQWGGLSPEGLPLAFSKKMFAEDAELAAKCGWWCSEIDNVALASAQAIDLILACLDEAESAPAATQAVNGAAAKPVGTVLAGGVTEESLAEDTDVPDGPFGGDGFAWNGVLRTGLTSTQAAIMRALWNAKSGTIYRADIDAAWPPDNSPDWNAVGKMLSDLRKKLAPLDVTIEARTHPNERIQSNLADLRRGKKKVSPR